MKILDWIIKMAKKLLNLDTENGEQSWEDAEKKIEYFSQLAFDERAKILPEYKLINASLGVYDATETARIKGIVEHYRNEFYRLEALCKQAKSVEELELIEANYEIQ